MGAPFIFVAGCGGSDGDTFAEPTAAPATPSTPAEVDTTYEQIGRGCGDDGSLVRSLTHVSALTTNNLWIAPGNDDAGLAASRNDNGWGASVGVYELGFESSGDSMESRSAEQAARCDAVREIFDPAGDGARHRSLDVLVYAGDHPHAEAMPAEGLPAAVEAPVRLKGYLDVRLPLNEGPRSGGVTSERVHVHRDALEGAPTRELHPYGATLRSRRVRDRLRLAVVDKAGQVAPARVAAELDESSPSGEKVAHGRHTLHAPS
ncbi:hypothetical protein WME92_43850 [Sorangium sp. So ce307]|uniref:hypothetical protein n=1 Tax=Sorangium cellulosum TaxID=56 RepID=UPI003D9C60EA